MRRLDSEPLTLFELELALDIEPEELAVELELELSTDFSSSGWIDPLPNVFTQLSLLFRTFGSSLVLRGIEGVEDFDALAGD